MRLAVAGQRAGALEGALEEAVGRGEERARVVEAQGVEACVGGGHRRLSGAGRSRAVRGPMSWDLCKGLR